MGLGVDVVLGPFFIHRDDALLPFGIGVGNSESDVHNDLRIGSGYPLADCLDQHSSFRLIIPLSCGLSLHLSEEEIGGTGHSDLPHLFLMDEFDGGGHGTVPIPGGRTHPNLGICNGALH